MNLKVFMQLRYVQKSCTRILLNQTLLLLYLMRYLQIIEKQQEILKELEKRIDELEKSNVS